MALIYSEKGGGLHAAIADAGYKALWFNGQFIAANPVNEAAIQALIDSYPVSSLIIEIKAQIDAYAATLRNKAVAGVSPAEMAKWQEKYRQAKAFKTTPVDATAPDVAAEARARGIATDALATKIITKGDTLSALEASIAGVSGKHQDAIAAMTTFSAVLAYNWQTGWPAV